MCPAVPVGFRWCHNVWRCWCCGTSGHRAALAHSTPGSAHRPHLTPKRCRVTLSLVSISEQSNTAASIMGNTEVKSVCASWGFFMSGYVEFYNEGRVHWRLLLRKVSMDSYFSFFSCQLAF